MGLIEQLIILAKESIDEANQRGRRPPAAPDPNDDEDEIQTLRRTLAQRAAEARAEQEFAKREEAQRRAELEQQRQAQEREQQRQRQRQTETARVTYAPTAVDARRIARLVRHPNALREMIVLREILDKPLALRRR